MVFVPYQLAISETVWEDKCEVCPSYMYFNNQTACDRQTAVDGRCFRGDWAQDNGWFCYWFKFPPQWTALDFTFNYKYWALGKWNKDYYGGSDLHWRDFEADTWDDGTDIMDENRNSESQCGNGWNTWTASDGNFDPYSLWSASDGDGSDDTACFIQRNDAIVDWTADNLEVCFWVWDDTIQEPIMSGPRMAEAWVVSDFTVTFDPTVAPTTTTVTTTTKSPTRIRTTSTPVATTTTTTDASTTTVKPTTTTMEIIETTTKIYPTTTVSTTASMTSATATEVQSKSTVASTSSAQLTTESTPQTTAEVTTTDGNDSEAKGTGDNWFVWALAGGVSVVALLLAALWFFGWRKGSDEAENDESQSQVKITVVTEMQQVLDTRTHLEEDVVVVLATPGDCDAEGNELKDALRRVDKAQRDERDSGFGRMLKDMDAGNALLQADVCLEVDGVLPPALCTDKGNGHDTGECESEEWDEFEDDTKAQEYITAGNISTSESESC